MIFFQIRRGHHHDAALQLHHQRDQVIPRNVVRLDPGVVLLKNRIPGVTGHIIDDFVTVLQKRVDDIFKILIKTALLRIEHQAHFA